MINGCADIVDRKTATKAVRIICRYFGGSLVYVPIKKTNGGMINEMHEALCDTVGDRDGKLILKKIMALFGGHQLYVPMEKSAFNKEIAREIHERLYKEKTRDLCREYAISFTQVYRLFYKGRKLYNTGVLK